MRKRAVVVLAGALMCSGAAWGKLPPPSPEEQAAAAAKKQAEAERLEKEKALLEKAQDRVVARYRKEFPKGQSGSAERTAEHNLPKTAREPSRGVGPKPDMPQSAEAHSANAK